MRKYLSIAILSLTMASSLTFTSCGNDDIDDDVEQTEPELKVWVEPYHIKGANVDEVKSYMAVAMTRYHLLAETSTADNMQLTYGTGNAGEGIIYSFSNLDGALYSVIDTELTSNGQIVIDYLNQHYIQVLSSDDANNGYCFTTEDKQMVITTMKVSETHFNVSYSFVY